MEITIEELRMFNGNLDWYNNHGEGYRIVYFYEDGSHYVGATSRTIKGFMMDFVECDPIIDEDDIPPFVSIDDLLSRYLEEVEDLKDITAVALYKTDGTCIQKLERSKNL